VSFTNVPRNISVSQKASIIIIIIAWKIRKTAIALHASQLVVFRTNGI
jgi:hypothetical protein